MGQFRERQETGQARHLSTSVHRDQGVRVQGGNQANRLGLAVPDTKNGCDYCKHQLQVKGPAQGLGSRRGPEKCSRGPTCRTEDLSQVPAHPATPPTQSRFKNRPCATLSLTVPWLSGRHTARRPAGPWRRRATLGEGWLVFRTPSVRRILFTGCRPDVFQAASLPLSLTSLQLGDSRHFQRPPGARLARAHAQPRPFPRRGLEPIGAPLSRRPVPPRPSGYDLRGWVGGNCPERRHQSASTVGRPCWGTREAWREGSVPTPFTCESCWHLGASLLPSKPFMIWPAAHAAASITNCYHVLSPWLSNLTVHQKHLEDLLKQSSPLKHPWSFWPSKSGMRSEDCISNKFQGGADAAALGLAPWESLYSVLTKSLTLLITLHPLAFWLPFYYSHFTEGKTESLMAEET